MNVTCILKMAASEFATGLPNKGVSTMPSEFNKPKKWDIVLHEHDAVRRGKHYDLRLSDGSVAYSWALDGPLPEQNTSIAAIKQPDHTHKYMDFSGQITSEYGKGKVKKAYRGKAEVMVWNGTIMRFNIYDGPYKGEYTLVKPSEGKAWKLMNHTMNREKYPDFPESKPPYAELDPKKDKDKITELMSSPDYIEAEKLDGAHLTVKTIGANKRVRVASYRPSERKTGIIDHTYKFEKLNKFRTPKGFGNSLFRAEAVVFDKNTGLAIPAKDLGGILNSDVWKSREKQKVLGDLKLALIDVDKFKGKDYSGASYEEKLKVMTEAMRSLPKDVFFLPDMAYAPEESAKLYDSIMRGEKASTNEGVVFWNLKKNEKPIKVKFKPDYDVYVRGVFEGEGRLKGKGVGGFTYSWSPEGEIVGRVGTGLTDALREAMREDPNKFIGRVAKVQALAKFLTSKGAPGALRSPAFKEWHLDKGKESR